MLLGLWFVYSIGCHKKAGASCVQLGKPLRVAEMNTISNSGLLGVSNVFAGEGTVGVMVCLLHWLLLKSLLCCMKSSCNTVALLPTRTPLADSH